MSYSPAIDYQLPIAIERLRYIRSSYEFPLELGGSLPELGIGYHTYGKLNAHGNNAIWVCHPMALHSNIRDWWPNMIGPGLAFDTDKYYVICANILGSCFGSTGARSLDPISGRAYGMDFPAITIRDQVKMHGILAKRLGIKKIKLCMGAMDSGFQTLEFAALFPELIEQLLIISSAAHQTKTLLRIHNAQVEALEADADFRKNRDGAGQKGMEALDNLDLITYPFKLDLYAHNFWHLSKTVDLFDFGLGRENQERALSKLNQPSLIIGNENDEFFPISAQQFLALHIPQCNFETMFSTAEHFGFLKESDKISAFIRKHRLL